MKHLSIVEPTKKPSLREVRKRFETWRRGKKRGSRIPKDLWAAAVEICAEQSVNQVSRGLGLNHTELKRRVAGTERSVDGQSLSGTDFLELPLRLGTDPVVYSVEFERTGGDKLKMTLSCKCREFDPLELARVFFGEGR
jgi:hypothetical protein